MFKKIFIIVFISTHFLSANNWNDCKRFQHMLTQVNYPSTNCGGMKNVFMKGLMDNCSYLWEEDKGAVEEILHQSLTNLTYVIILTSELQNVKSYLGA